LFQLGADGSKVLDNSGNAVPTYGNENIMDFARIFTGFDQQLPRGNIEAHMSRSNMIDPMQTEKYAFRITFEFLFFILVLVLLLNIIFGITIDQFGELRDKAKEDHKLRKEYCFICHCTKERFDNHYMLQNITGGFEKHVKEEHNMWDYLHYMIYVSAKEETEMSGIESYVKDKLRQDNHSWMPNDIAMCLTSSDEGANEKEDELSNVQESISRLQSDMHNMNDAVHKINDSIQALQRVIMQGAPPATGVAVAPRSSMVADL